VKFDTFCVDVGSIAGGNFAWAHVGPDGDERRPGTDIEILADHISQCLSGAGSGSVALGFESPTFIPVRPCPDELGKQRAEEKGRPWSGGPGGTVLPTGLVQMLWLFRTLKLRNVGVKAHVDWIDFEQSGGGLFIWEAFVSHKRRRSTHEEDAQAAAREFQKKAVKGDLNTSDSESRSEYFSLAGAALSWAGIETPANVLETPLVFVSASVN